MTQPTQNPHSPFLRATTSSLKVESNTGSSSLGSQTHTHTHMLVIYGSESVPRYNPALECTGVLSGCEPAAHYFAAVLAVHFFWQRTWATEQRLTQTSSAFKRGTVRQHAGGID